MGSYEAISFSDGFGLKFYPYDRNLFKAFSSLFLDGRFEAKKYMRIKKTLAIVRKYRTAETQLVPFEKFDESVGLCSALNFSTATRAQKHLFSELHQRYKKLFRLIVNNSVLLQHFGIEDEEVAEKECLKFDFKGHYICMEHIFEGTGSELLAAGHIDLGSDKSRMPCNFVGVRYKWDEVLNEKGRLPFEKLVPSYLEHLCDWLRARSVNKVRVVLGEGVKI